MPKQRNLFLKKE